MLVFSGCPILNLGNDFTISLSPLVFGEGRIAWAPDYHGGQLSSTNSFLLPEPEKGKAYLTGPIQQQEKTQWSLVLCSCALCLRWSVGNVLSEGARGSERCPWSSPSVPSHLFLTQLSDFGKRRKHLPFLCAWLIT